MTDYSVETLFASSCTFVGREFVNFGTAQWAGGLVKFENGAKFTNRGAFHANSSSGTFGEIGGVGSFDNYGYVVKPTADYTYIDMPYNSMFGSVTEVFAGRLLFLGGGQESGTFRATGGLIDFSRGSYTLTGASFTGAGRVNVYGTAHFSVPAGASATSSTMLWLNADSLALGGSGSFSSSGTLVWEKGHIEDLTQLSLTGSLSIQGTAMKALTNTQLNNSARAVWADAGSIHFEDAVFQNFNEFEIRNNARMSMIGSSVFRNVGTGVVKKSVGGGGLKTIIEAPFENFSRLQLQGYEIEFHQGLIQSGAAAVTDLAGGQITVAAGKVFAMGGGLLTGDGVISGDLLATEGTVLVGAGVSRTLRVTGNYTQASAAKLRVQITALGGGNFGWGLLDITGTAQLAGAIEFVPAPGMPVGSSGTVLKAGTRNDTLTPQMGPVWTVTPVGNDLVVTKNM